MLPEEKKERLRSLTVELLLDVRSQYLQTPGCNVLKHWDQLTSRMRAAARMTEGPDEWATRLLRALQIASPSKYSSDSLLKLSHQCREWQAESEFLDLIEREHALLIAMTRKCSEERADARAAAKETDQ
jgi:hypothetical protein